MISINKYFLLINVCRPTLFGVISLVPAQMWLAANIEDSIPSSSNLSRHFVGWMDCRGRETTFPFPFIPTEAQTTPVGKQLS